MSIFLFSTFIFNQHNHQPSVPVLFPGQISHLSSIWYNHRMSCPEAMGPWSSVTVQRR